MHSTTFWDSIKNSSGWYWALAEISRNRDLLEERGMKWGESPLHWACLSNLNATMEIIKNKPELEWVADSSGRLPLDWVIEKIYFMREDACKFAKDDKVEFAINQARDCALFLLRPEFGGESSYLAFKENLQRSFKVSLAAGEFELAKLIDEKLKMSLAYWLGGIAGKWQNISELKKFTQFLKNKFDFSENSLFEGKTIGIHVAYLWAASKINTESALMFHKLGFSLESETANFSLETACVDFGVSDSEYSALIKKLG